MVIIHVFPFFFEILKGGGVKQNPKMEKQNFGINYQPAVIFEVLNALIPRGEISNYSSGRARDEKKILKQGTKIPEGRELHMCQT